MVISLFPKIFRSHSAKGRIVGMIMEGFHGFQSGSEEDVSEQKRFILLKKLASCVKLGNLPLFFQYFSPEIEDITHCGGLQEVGRVLQ